MIWTLPHLADGLAGKLMTITFACHHCDLAKPALPKQFIRCICMAGRMAAIRVHMHGKRSREALRHITACRPAWVRCEPHAHACVALRTTNGAAGVQIMQPPTIFVLQFAKGFKAAAELRPIRLMCLQLPWGGRPKGHNLGRQSAYATG